MKSSTVWRSSLAAALALALGCRSLPADPDGDGRPEGARPLELGVAAHDSMKCDEGDCADWYTIEVEKKGSVDVELDPDTGSAWDVEVEVVLYDTVGNQLARETSEGRPSLSVKSDLAPGKYYIAVGSAKGGNAVPYQLVARQERKAAPAPTAGAGGAGGGKKAPATGGRGPKVETRRGSVLEVSDGGKAVLLDIGKSQGIKVGQKGRLFTDGAAAGALEIVEVYPEGSLARLSGEGKAEANSTAEIDVPQAAPAPAR